MRLMMKWIKSSDQFPPKDRSFIGFTGKDRSSIGFTGDEIGPFRGMMDIYNWDGRGDGDDKYVSVGSCDGCNNIDEKNILYWMDLPERPDGI
jgi:hypothetical protein